MAKGRLRADIHLYPRLWTMSCHAMTDQVVVLHYWSNRTVLIWTRPLARPPWCIESNIPVKHVADTGILGLQRLIWLCAAPLKQFSSCLTASSSCNEAGQCTLDLTRLSPSIISALLRGFVSFSGCCCCCCFLLLLFNTPPYSSIVCMWNRPTIH